MKNYFFKSFRKFYGGIIDRLLNNNKIKHKYVIVYLLEYIEANGIRAFLRGCAGVLKQHGAGAFLKIRKIVVFKIQNKGKETLPPYSPEQIKEKDISNMKADAAKFVYKPKISFIIPTYNTKPFLLTMTINSILQQAYENWEICIADDHSTREDTINLLKTYVQDERIQIVFLPSNTGISEASNTAIRLATGEYLALLDHDDEITRDALFFIVKYLNEYGQNDILYSDECKVDENGNLSDYFFKPDWSPELLFNSMYTGHLTVYNKKFLLEKVGLFRKEYDFSQDYDLMLRASEKTSKILHIPKVLYHWRLTEGSAAQGDKPYARQSNLAALKAAVERRNLPADVVALPAANRVKLRIEQVPFVSIIIPTDSFENLLAAIESINSITDYPGSYEIVAVTNSVLIKEMEEISLAASVAFVAYDQPYNFSDKCNHGAATAKGDLLIFFNDDVRVLQSDWIENTIEYLFVPGVGGVSPKLIYENDTIQYAGMAAGVRNLIGTTLHGYHKDSYSYINYVQLVRNVSILSGACLAIQKKLFLQLGGFDAINTPSAHSDTDLSFKILEKGLRCVYTPYATLRHIGHLSLQKYEAKKVDSKDKADLFLLKKWIKYLAEDIYFLLAMRDYLYHDSPEPFQLYSPGIAVETKNGKDILAVSHDLSLSGAPISLFDTCRILLRNGYFVVVSSPVDGPLRKKYQAAGIPVIVDSLLLKQHPSFFTFAKNFDYLFCNTIVTWPVVKQMKDIVNIIWWIQEAKILEAFMIDPDCEKTLKEAQRVIGLSDYALSFIHRYNAHAIKLYNACFDIYTVSKEKNISIPQNKTILSLIGSLEKRKGQDILIKALKYIDPALLKKLEIRIIGREQDSIFAKQIHLRANKMDCIRFWGQVSHDKCIELIKETDVLLNTSRDEPFSVVLVEGFCLAKPCIVSECTGIAELITDGENGLIFRHEDAIHLAEKISWVLNNTGKLGQIGLSARETYKNHLTIAGFEKSLLNLLNKKQTIKAGI